MSSQEFSRARLTQTPLATRIFTIVIISCSVAGLIKRQFIDELIDIPYYTFYNFQVYRFFLSTYFGLDIVNLLITLYLFIPSAAYLEKFFGSARLMSVVLFISVMINVCHDSLCFLIYFTSGDPTSLYWPCFGFLGTSLAMFNMRCLSVSTIIYSLCSLFDVINKLFS